MRDTFFFFFNVKNQVAAWAKIFWKSEDLTSPFPKGKIPSSCHFTSHSKALRFHIEEPQCDELHLRICSDPSKSPERACLPDFGHNPLQVFSFLFISLFLTSLRETMVSTFLSHQWDRRQEGPQESVLESDAPTVPKLSYSSSVLASSQPEWQEGDRRGRCKGPALSVGKTAGRRKGPLHVV